MLATEADKKACWTEAARRAKFFLDADPCETRANQSDEERDNCKMDRAKQATARLDAYYRSIQKALRADLAKGRAAKWDDSTFLAELQKTQAAWARYRDLECQAETTPYDGGTVTISIKAGCEREKAEARLKELHRYLRPLLTSELSERACGALPCFDPNSIPNAQSQELSTVLAVCRCTLPLFEIFNLKSLSA